MPPQRGCQRILGTSAALPPGPVKYNHDFTVKLLIINIISLMLLDTLDLYDYNHDNMLRSIIHHAMVAKMMRAKFHTATLKPCLPAQLATVTRPTPRFLHLVIFLARPMLSAWCAPLTAFKASLGTKP